MWSFNQNQSTCCSFRVMLFMHSHILTDSIACCHFFSLQGLKKPVDLRHSPILGLLSLSLFLLLNRDLKAHLQSENLPTLLLMIFFPLLPLIQRVKQRVCWKSFNTVKSKQDWQVRLEIPQVIFTQGVRLFQNLDDQEEQKCACLCVQLQIWKFLCRCRFRLNLQQRVQHHLSVSLLLKCPSHPPPITTASLWTCAAWEASA